MGNKQKRYIISGKKAKIETRFIAGVPEEKFKIKGSAIRSPIKTARAKRRMKAAMDLLGMWEDKDTSFFDRRKA